MNKAIEKKIQKIYAIVFNRVYSKTNLAKLSRGDRSDVCASAVKIESSEAYNEFAKKFAEELAKEGVKHERGLWKKYYQAARKMRYISLPPSYAAFEYDIMKKAIQTNFKMIKSIPTEMLSILERKYTSDLIEEVAKGTRNRGSFQRELEKHGYKNAKLVARTETAKLQTAIMEERAKDVGSVAYVWLASNDKRTRPSHKQMNGVVVFWRDNLEKPLRDNMRGNAGEFPNCRCTPQPIVDLDELTKSNYKVYDYHTDTIITLSKAELVDALLNKELK